MSSMCQLFTSILEESVSGEVALLPRGITLSLTYNRGDSRRLVKRPPAWDGVVRGHRDECPLLTSLPLTQPRLQPQLPDLLLVRDDGLPEEGVGEEPDGGPVPAVPLALSRS